MTNQQPIVCFHPSQVPAVSVIAVLAVCRHVVIFVCALRDRWALEDMQQNICQPLCHMTQCRCKLMVIMETTRKVCAICLRPKIRLGLIVCWLRLHFIGSVCDVSGINNVRLPVR